MTAAPGRRAPVLALLAMAGASASADASLGTVEFSPPSFLPGEAVTIYASLDPGSARWVEETRSSGFLEQGATGPTMLSASVETRSGAPLLVARFVPWVAGPGYLEEFSVGGLDVPRIRFECASALSDERPPEPFPQLDHPGLYARLYMLGGALIAAAIAGIAAATGAAPWFRAFMARRAFARARREFDELLDGLGRRGAGAASWAELCAGLRRFGGLRSGADWGALTAPELGRMPDDAAPGGVRDDVAALVSMGDAVRFAGRDDQDIAGGLALARSIADRLDAACAAPPPGAARRGAA